MPSQNSFPRNPSIEEIKRQPWALQNAEEDLRSNRALILEVVEKNGSVLRYASSELQDDTEVVHAALKSYALEAIRYASTRLQNDAAAVKIAVTKDPWAILHVGKEMSIQLKAALDPSSQDNEAKEILAICEQKNDVAYNRFRINSPDELAEVRQQDKELKDRAAGQHKSAEHLTERSTTSASVAKDEVNASSKQEGSSQSKAIAHLIAAMEASIKALSQRAGLTQKVSYQLLVNGGKIIITESKKAALERILQKVKELESSEKAPTQETNQKETQDIFGGPHHQATLYKTMFYEIARIARDNRLHTARTGKTKSARAFASFFAKENLESNSPVKTSASEGNTSICQKGFFGINARTTDSQPVQQYGNPVVPPS